MRYRCCGYDAGATRKPCRQRALNDASYCAEHELLRLLTPAEWRQDARGESVDRDRWEDALTDAIARHNRTYDPSKGEQWIDEHTTLDDLL